jgi:osmotically-inducible protein OsmY
MLALLLTANLLQGCGALVVGGVATGAAVIHDRREEQTVLQDQNIELQSTAAFYQDAQVRDDCRIAATSYNLVVLLTGQCGEQASADRFADSVSRLAKVRRVVNEVTVGPIASFSRESEDVLLTSRAKFAVTQVDMDDFDATRVKVVTEAGVVYLMGLVTPAEAEAVVENVRYIPGVKKVVKVFEYTQPAASDA